MVRLRGILPALVTPMFGDETINKRAIKQQVDRVIDAGVHGIYCLGTNGEFYALSIKEKMEIMESVVESVDGRVPVVANTGGITTSETITLTHSASKVGVDAISLISPYFIPVTQRELFQHVSQIAYSTDLPVILYNIPMRTGCSYEREVLLELAKIPNIIGIKDSSGDFNNTVLYIDETEDDFHVFSGNDSLILWTLQAGGVGGVSGIANIFPRTIVQIYTLWERGDFQEALEVQNSIRMIRDTFKYGNPNTVVKQAMNILGHDVGPARSPVAYVMEEYRVDLKERVLHFQKNQEEKYLQ